jgi:hypothetical protein
MEIKLKGGNKLKAKNISLDERDMLLDKIEYTYNEDGTFQGVKMMNSTITQWIRTCIEKASDKMIMSLSFEDRTEIFTKLQSMFTMGEEKASK